MIRVALLALTFVAAPIIADDVDDWGQVKEAVSQTLSLKEEQKASSPAEKPAIEKKIEKKLDLIDQVGDKHVADPAAQVKVAQAFLQVAEPARALNRADKAIALAPQDPQARAVRAQSYFKLGRYEEAAADARLALKLDPGSEQASAVLRLSAGRVSSAPAAPNGPARSAALAAAGGSAANSNTTTAASAAVAGAEAQARQVKAADYLGQAAGRLGLGDQAAAIVLLDKAAALDPKNARIYLMRGKAKLDGASKSQAASAVFDAEQAMALSPTSAAARLLFARAQDLAGFPQEQVLAAYKAAAELDPDLTQAYESALARYRGGGASAQQAAAQPQTQGTAPAHLLSGRLPLPVKKIIPWGTAFLAVFGVWWFWLARKNAA